MTSPYNQQLGDPTQAARFDAGKVRLELVPAEAVEAMGRVFTHGSQKYDDWNWAKGFPWLQPYASLMRHLMAWHRGENIDPESGLPHLDHAITNLAMLITFRERGIGQDTRYRYPNAQTLEMRQLITDLGEAFYQKVAEHGPAYEASGIVGSQPVGLLDPFSQPPEIDDDEDNWEDEEVEEWLEDEDFEEEDEDPEEDELQDDDFLEDGEELLVGDPLSFKARVPNPLRSGCEVAIEGQPLRFTIEVQLPAPTDDGFLWCELPSSVRTRSHVLARVQALREDGYCNRVIRVHRVAERLVRDESEDVDGFGGSGWIQEGTITRLERIIFPGDGRVYP